MSLVLKVANRKAPLTKAEVVQTLRRTISSESNEHSLAALKYAIHLVKRISAVSNG